MAQNRDGQKNHYFAINDKRVDLSDDNSSYQFVGVDFTGEERYISSFNISNTDLKEVYIYEIYIYLDDEVVMNNEDFPMRYEYKDKSSYELPTVSIGGFDNPGLIYCRMQNVLTGDVRVVDYQDDVKAYVTTSDGGKLEEGRYRLEYGMNITSSENPKLPEFDPSACLPKYFEIYPSVEGLEINWIKVSESGVAYVPDKGDEDWTNIRTWDNALIGGLREGITAYWKVEQIDRPGSDTVTGGEQPNYAPSHIRYASDAAMTENSIPEGYTKYGAHGINLRKGNTLNLILEKNGVRTDNIVIPYAHRSEATSVDGPEIAPESEQTEYYSLSGVKLNPESLPKGEIVIVKTSGGAKCCKLPR